LNDRVGGNEYGWPTFGCLHSFSERVAQRDLASVTGFGRVGFLNVGAGHDDDSQSKTFEQLLTAW
jgi:hypothetical protein